MAAPKSPAIYGIAVSDLPERVREVCRHWPEAGTMRKIAHETVPTINLTRLQFELRALHGKILSAAFADEVEWALAWCGDAVNARKPCRKRPEDHARPTA